ncbi:hypothetical protein [Dietzia cercidiphylli]|uniref:hypothetical protein n=1 Tax=Dietzia cercidiphylli TaxID=498199 RepID=UPI00223A7492|nr:hypothetical protein [Dietzia cercidiphylli]MCT1514731.1 hypothetical protein [Dietzia cercidiphylli]
MAALSPSTEKVWAWSQGAPATITALSAAAVQVMQFELSAPQQLDWFRTHLG